MPFDTLTPRLKMVATKAMAHCRKHYGGNGLKAEEEIASAIAWRPTFFLKPTSTLILAVEVSDVLYPEALKIAGYEIGHYDFPIAVCQACSLDVYQSDKGMKKISLLRDHGFGIITVADDGDVSIQHGTIPLAQHISPELLDMEMSGLSTALKPKFRLAHTSYRTNEGQGLQQAGQIVEGMVNSLAHQAIKGNLIAAGSASRTLAGTIDALYGSASFTNHRAALGAARSFVKDFRNTASHAPRSAKEAAEKIRKCRAGFLDAISNAKKLRVVMQAMGYTVKIHTT